MKLLYGMATVAAVLYIACYWTLHIGAARAAEPVYLINQDCQTGQWKGDNQPLPRGTCEALLKAVKATALPDKNYACNRLLLESAVCVEPDDFRLASIHQ